MGWSWVRAKAACGIQPSAACRRTTDGLPKLPRIRGDIGLRGNAEHAGLPDLPFADLQGQANAATGVSKLGEKCAVAMDPSHPTDRKSTRLNSSHLGISYAVFCLKKKVTKVATSHGSRVFCLCGAPCHS